MINWFDMPAEGLSNGGLFEVKELEVTENGTYETKGEMYNKVTVNVEGGGGSSDFSLAQVTITGGEGECGLSMVRIEEEGVAGMFQSNTYQELPLTCKCVLYKGSQSNICVSDEDGNNYPGSALAVTGNIVIDDAEFGFMTVTGDGTITISAE